MAKKETPAVDGAVNAETRSENDMPEPRNALVSLEEPAAVEAPTPEKRTPAEWAEKRGLIEHKRPGIPQSVTFSKPGYAEAAALFCWELAAHNLQAKGDMFRLSEEDFLAAIEAAKEFPLERLPDGAIPPRNAFAPNFECHARLVDFQPRARNEETS